MDPVEFATATWVTSSIINEPLSSTLASFYHNAKLWLSTVSQKLSLEEHRLIRQKSRLILDTCRLGNSCQLEMSSGYMYSSNIEQKIARLLSPLEPLIC